MYYYVVPRPTLPMNLGQMRQRAHHHELQLTNYHICNFQFKTYFGSCVSRGFSSECQATRFLQRIFLFLCIFTSGVFQTLIYIGTNVLQQSNWLKNDLTSPIEAFRVEKSSKKWTKAFAEGVFFLSCGESFIGQGSKKCPDMPAKFQGCPIFIL